MTEHAFAVHVEVRRKADDQNWAITSHAIEALADQLTGQSGVVSGGPGYDHWTATVTVTARDAVDATIRAAVVVRHARSAAGLPDGDMTRAEAVREDVLDQDLARPQMPDLVSGPEAAQILGVSVQRVHQLAAEHAGFPQPAYKYDRVSLWHRAAVEKFLDGWERKPGRPRNNSAA